MQNTTVSVYEEGLINIKLRYESRKSPESMLCLLFLWEVYILILQLDYVYNMAYKSVQRLSVGFRNAFYIRFFIYII